jgi:glutamine synthetase type III
MVLPSLLSYLLVLLACLSLSAVIDPTSPIFMRGDTIHIPCVFISWTGLALDEKTPLLRAEQVRSLFLVTSLS